MASERVISLAFNDDDLQLLTEAVRTELETGIKTGQHKRRVHLYRLQRRLTRARLALER
jgi:hypothetical protein